MVKKVMAHESMDPEYSQARFHIENILLRIQPWDDLENDHLRSAIKWVRSDTPIFRIQKPDVPPKHLVSYFVLFDEDAGKILLVDHKKAQLWLPTGGHLEPKELPCEAVKRECFEELGIQAEFWSCDPLFLTSTQTIGLTAGHTDVSFWYVLKGHSNASYAFDRNEFASIRWFDFSHIPYEKSDPHMRRFIHKLGDYLK